MNENAQMGTTSIKKLTEIVSDPNFKEMLKKQFSEYSLISNKASEIIKENSNENAKDASALQKAQIYMMINIKTLLNKTPDNIAGMLMQGSVMGIIQITRRLKQYENLISQDLKELGEKLLKIEEQNLIECRNFLGQK